MHLIICNERLLFRFGVDRVLLLLAARLKKAGWKITLIAQRADRAVLQEITPHVITPPPCEGSYLDLDDATSIWLDSARSQVLGEAQDRSDTFALLGGWPYYGAIAVFRRWGIPVVALDCGAVPTTGMQGGALEVQEKLRARRREYLPEAQVVTPISHFIERTQSRRDAGPGVEIRTIHLGSDHLVLPDACPHEADGNSPAAWPCAAPAPRILNLGRWEPGNYKNSEALFSIARSILARCPTASFAVLAEKKELSLPSDLQHCIHPLGHPPDEQLVRIMAEADLGVSVSLWEGFNLPLAEMQQLGKPVLIFDLGAHPEVVAHPWQLCASEAEMGEKAAHVLSNAWLAPGEWKEAVLRFSERLTWDRTLDAYQKLLFECVPVRDPQWPQLVVDASACLRDPANTGVARVVRSLSRKLQDFGRPLFVTWDEYLQAYVLPTEVEYQNLASYGGPDPNPAHYTLPRSQPHRRLLLGGIAGNRLRGGWLLQGEIIFERQGPQRRAAARLHGLQVAAIFYDAIPVTHPQWVPDIAIRDNHASYMRGLADCDRVLPISPDAEEQLHTFWSGQHIQPRALARHCWIPGELSASPRAAAPPVPPMLGQPVRLLCVSTLEPRKNHQTLLAAMQQIAHQHPELEWELHLIGNRYAGGEAIVEQVRQAIVADSRIVWHGIVDDETLNQHYAQAHLTIYPSLVEGYGMPIVESLWHGRPCLCHHAGVMAQLAAEGGCQTVDMNDASCLAEAIVALSTDPGRYVMLSAQALERHILTWRGYARALLTQLAGHHPAKRTRPMPTHWQHFLQPNGVSPTTDPWLTALAALLRGRPSACCLLLGEFAEAELAMIGAFVPQAWQLIDNQVMPHLAKSQQVSQISGPIEQILPLVWSTLEQQGLMPDLILVSAEMAKSPGLLKQLPFHGMPDCLTIFPLESAEACQSALGLSSALSISFPGHQGFANPSPSHDAILSLP